jgi:hypothetical protein
MTAKTAHQIAEHNLHIACLSFILQSFSVTAIAELLVAQSWIQLESEPPVFSKPLRKLSTPFAYRHPNFSPIEDASVAEANSPLLDNGRTALAGNLTGWLGIDPAKALSRLK